MKKFGLASWTSLYSHCRNLEISAFPFTVDLLALVWKYIPNIFPFLLVTFLFLQIIHTSNLVGHKDYYYYFGCANRVNLQKQK